jgi:hypothetical protein
MKVALLGYWTVRTALYASLLFQLSNNLTAQQTPPHDITQVDAAPLGGAIATPLPEAQRKQLMKYEIPELAGSRQALGSQLVNDTLPRPMVDYVVQDAKLQQRISIFQGGLVVVDIRGAGGPIRKRVIIPDDALQNYMKSVASIVRIRQSDVPPPRDDRRAFLRVYNGPHDYTERLFDPATALPHVLNDEISPLRDLLRAITEDRAVTNTIAGYKPKEGDQLVGDDRKVYLVVRVMNDSIVELRCMSQPTTMYVAVKDLYNYFIGTTGAAQE